MSTKMTGKTETLAVYPHQWTDGGEHVLILRRINADGTSYGGFNRWGEPDELNITVEPEAWSPGPTCGNGLHGWPWGWAIGDGCDYSIVDDRWLVLAARPEDVVSIGGLKCKCRHATKIYDGAFAGAWAMINDGRHRLIEAMAAGESESCASGDCSTAAASGYGSTAASSGYGSTAASSGDRSTAASSGDCSTAAASGYGSTAASSGYGSTAASSGNCSTAAASGYGSKAASSGYGSKAASSGYGSTAAQAGKSGVAASIGSGGTVMAGENGALVLCYWSPDEERYRVVVGYVGENGIKPNTRYRLGKDHVFEEMI